MYSSAWQFPVFWPRETERSLFHLEEDAPWRIKEEKLGLGPPVYSDWPNSDAFCHYCDLNTDSEVNRSSACTIRFYLVIKNNV